MTSLPRVFRLFRALGLRHLIVINDLNEVRFVVFQIIYVHILVLCFIPFLIIFVIVGGRNDY